MTASTTYCNECGASNPLQATQCFACRSSLYPPAPSPLLRDQAVPENAAVLPGSLAPSSLLHSRYSIVCQVGTGGFGAVYKAKDTLFSHRLVAIKEMNQDGLNGDDLAEATAAFEHEALLLTNLTHPNLPRIHDHFTERGRAYVIMDFIAGDTLEDYLDKTSKGLPLKMVLEIGLQLCTVLDYLHSQKPPIIFRDLKPANIMRTADNHVYLIDFGIARHFKPGKAKDTIPLGSKGYAAPEQYGKAQSTPQSDIYGLGATLHQLLTGNDPSLALFHFEPLQANNVDNSSITVQLNALLDQMLEMEMSKRPASMAIVKQELQHLLAQQMPRKPASIVKRRTFLKGFLSAVATGSASIALATFVVKNPNVVGLLFDHSFTGSTPVHSPSPSTPAQATILDQTLYTYRGHAGSVTAVAWSPRGQYIASAGTIDSSVQVWDAKTGKRFFHFVMNNQGVDGLAWSSDGTCLASVLDNGVTIWNIKTGEKSLFPLNQAGKGNALAWSPDGSRIAAVSGNTSVQVLSATTGKPLVIYTSHTQKVFTLAWSPDGKTVASGAADGIVQVWDASTGHTRMTYHGHSAAVNAVAWSPDSSQIVSGGTDGTVQVWDAATGRLIFTYRGHSGAVNAVAWQIGAQLLPGSEARIASGGADTTVQVWSFGRVSDVMPRQAMVIQGEALIYRGHSAQVTSISWSSNGQHIASGSEDGTVQIWQAM